MSDIIKLLPCVDSETNDKAMRAILNGIDYLITKEIKDAPFDKVYTGIIKTVNSDNTYDLTIGGNLYKGVPSMFKASFAENDIVKVVSPQNQMGNIFIFGKMNMEVSGSSKIANVAWDVISDKPSDLVQDAQYVHTDNNYTTLEKEKLNTIEEGAQKNTITGIKGDAETSYRQGDVNITKANIGLDKVDNTPDAEKTVENATKLGNQAPDYYATSQSVADENERAIIAEQENSALIGSEIKRAESAENDLSTKLTAETERAQKAEKANTDAIEVLNGEATVEGSVAYKIAQIVTVTGIKGDAETAYRQGNVNITKANIGLSNVENKNSATIRNELTKENVTKALGYTPPKQDTDTKYSAMVGASTTEDGAEGLVTKPTAGSLSRYLRVDGGWETPPDTTDLTKMSGILSVAHGGTGASDAKTARANLGITKDNLGIANVTNYDQSKAIKSITRNGTTYTATRLDGTTFTFTQQDKDTIYSLPLATNGTRGGVQIGYSQNGKNYPVQLSSEKMFVNVPWTDHYDWGDITGKPTNVGASNRGIYLNGTTFTAVSWYPNYCTIDGGNTANFPWHRIATCTTGTGQFVDKSAIVVIHSRHDGGAYGMIKICVRTKSSKMVMGSSAVWLFRYGFNVGDVIITSGGTTGTDTRFNVWLKCGNWPRRIAYILEGSNNGWSLVNSWEPDNCTSASQGAEIYASVSGKVAIDGANVDYANSAGNGISNITRSGTTFTVTRANGTTFTFTQQDNDTKALGSMTGTLAIGHGGTGATTASGARTNLGIGTLGTKNVIEKGDLTLKFVNGNTLQLVNSAGTVISSMLYIPKIEWNQSTFTSYVWNE